MSSKNDRPTNLQYLIAVLSGEIDDGGAAFESVVHYNLNCPHFVGEQNLPCKDAEPSREVCWPCKLDWLNAEVDK